MTHNPNAGARLYEETLDLIGTPMYEVLDKLDACQRAARTPLAQWRLSLLYDGFIEHVRVRWGLA